ncbi:MATE family efflux transporter [Lactococcus lactis]|nr:MATE family efflux transporter [Lactococcus lactis]
MGARPILYLLGARQRVLELSIIYLSLVGGLIVLLALMTTFGAFLRADGNTKTPMWASFFCESFKFDSVNCLYFCFSFRSVGNSTWSGYC